MRRDRKWLLALGIMAVTPGITLAGPLSFLKSNTGNTAASTQTRTAKNENQLVAEAIAAELRKAKMTGFDIEIEYKNGIARLSGMIANARQKARVAQIVSKVNAVKRVDNRLTVMNRTGASQPKANDAPATLNVPFDAKPANAGGAGQSTQTIQKVQHAPKLLSPNATQSTPPKPAIASGSQPNAVPPTTPRFWNMFKKSRVEHANFQQDTSQKATGIQLAGFMKRKKVAASSARRTPSINNQRMAEQIADALKRARIKGYDIDIRCQQGTASLFGSVHNEQQRAKITRVVSKVPGVRMVNNRLALLGQPAPRRKSVRQPSSKKSEQNQQMAQRIAGALRYARLNGYDIEIRYENGTATLSGSVATPQQRAQVTQVASQVPGVQVVDNRLGLGGSPAGAPSPTFQPSGFPVSGPGLVQRNPFNRLPHPAMPIQQVSYQPGQPQPPATAPGPAVPPGGFGMPQQSIPGPPNYGHPGSGSSHTVYNMPHLPEYAWPSYASYPNYSQLSYPKEYSASAWPYIGPFYPYPQIPLGWRQVQLEWDDGYWSLNFRPRTQKWFWFIDPRNW